MKKFLTCITHACFFIFVFGCKNDIDTNAKLVSAKGYSLYWHHDLSSTEGRGLLFAFDAKEALTKDYDLEFDYTIKSSVILVRLVKVIDKGECPQFPGWGDPDLCNPNGKIYIPDKLLPPGKYSFEFIAENIKIVSQLDVTDEKVSINIPSNSKLSTNINEVYPIPKGLVFGSLVYSGSENRKHATSLIDDLVALGLTPATVPNHPYQYLDAQRNYHLNETSWEPDNHLISILFNTNGLDFKSIFDTAKSHFELSDNKLTGGIMSSNGDNVNMNPYDGIHVIYAK